MIGYTPLFSKIVDSSLWEEPDYVVKVFLTMLAKKDGDNVVRANAFNISRWAKKTEEETLEALKVLASPDQRRIEPQPFDGRRIEKVEAGWRLLNGEFYQNLMRDINRRAYKARKESEYRHKKNAGGKNTGDDGKPASPRYKSEEREYVAAAANGETRKADDIAARRTA